MTPTSEQRAAFEREWQGPSGWHGVFTAVNNQRLGLWFMVTALVFFGLGGVLALLMRVQLAVPENDFLHPQTYNELFTLHGSTMMFLFAVPFLEGLALYILPQLIGSRDVAYPRLSSFSYWTYLFGGIVFYASLLTGRPPDAGWFAYTPLSGPDYAGTGMDFWVMGLALVEVAGLGAGVEIVATLLTLRAPGMSLRRMPMFAWTLLVVGFMMIFAFTVLLVATLLLELDRVAGTRFFDPDFGGSSLLWQHLFWFFGHPEVYIMFLPATGIVSTLVVTAARRPLAAYALVAMAVMVTGFVSFGLWMHHMYTTGLPELGLSFFAAASLMIGVASGIQVFAWIATLWGTRPALTTPFLYVLGFFFIFVLGGFTGVMVAVVPFDWQVHDTFFIVAHFHYVLIGGVVFPIFAALHYWFPKITGRRTSEALGRWGFWLNFVGFNLTFFPMHVMGFLGLARRVYTYPESLGLGGYNLASTAGAFLMGLGFVVVVIALWQGWRKGEPAGDNPWGAGTLDGATTSPPPIYTFERPPVVYGREPLWVKTPATLDQRAERAADALRGAPVDWRATLSTDPLTGRVTGVQRLAGPSLAPFLSACGLLVAFLGVLLKTYLLVPLGLIFAASAWGYWLYPKRNDIARMLDSGLAEKAGVPVLLTGNQSTGWWGMLGLVTIAATALGALFYAYAYLWLFAPMWPPEGLLPPKPLLALVAAFVLVLPAALRATWGRSLTPSEVPRVRGALVMSVLLVILHVVLHVRFLMSLEFGPQDHAYGSIFWVISVVLLLFAVVQAVLLGTAWARLRGLEERELLVGQLQLQITALFTRFTAAAAVAIAVVLHLLPRWLS